MCVLHLCLLVPYTRCLDIRLCYFDTKETLALLTSSEHAGKAVNFELTPPCVPIKKLKQDSKHTLAYTYGRARDGFLW